VILEHALLPVKPGQEADFERAFATATDIISAAPGFRGSPAYEDWRALLHHFYDPFPVVEHYVGVLTADPHEAP
jgi:hypothetical protein